MTTTQLTPAADFILEIAMHRALGLIREGRFDAADLSLMVATDAANLVDVAERARIVRSARPVDGNHRLAALRSLKDNR